MHLKNVLSVLLFEENAEIGLHKIKVECAAKVLLKCCCRHSYNYNSLVHGAAGKGANPKVRRLKK